MHPHNEPGQGLRFDRSLIERLSASGPRYTSYPTADRFTERYGEAAYRRIAARRFGAGSERPLSIYVHLPFCNTICFYCACNKIATKDRRRADVYLDYLAREIELQAPLFAARSRVEQIHLGGGTPTFLNDTQLTRLMRLLYDKFTFAPDSIGEYSIEIDPRKVAPRTIHLLREHGLNRVSIGVQDLDPQVQEAVNRIQSEEETRNVVDAARMAGFHSISMDLIYGMPKQTVASFSRTLDRVIDMRPDRLSVYHYAHLPHLFMPQRRIHEAELPSSEIKLDILAGAIDKLTAAGYVYIGMDHFALPTDELARAQRKGTLHRNFQGYSTHDDIDLLGLGISSIGKIGASYSQNVRDEKQYYALLDEGRLPLFRGIELNDDDRLRRDLIQHLMCDFQLDFARFGRRWNIDFASYFAPEWPRLQELAAMGVVELAPDSLHVTDAGRLLVRNVAMVFDRYLREAQTTARYSKTV
ncbi:MAG: oxygen-independent coproporphyrinogen III oxidase [Burkholderiales bacterium]|nr:oxygen-independent coproporphyrinogen III oxidase [Burkholderiales bacterium]